MKVLLVDDERLVLERVRGMLDGPGHGYEIAATATNGRSALRLCEELRPSIVIADIRMPVMDGLALIRAAAERELGSVFVIMSAFEDFDCARQAIGLGNVAGYLVKHEMDRSRLLDAMRKAADAWRTEEKRRRTERTGLLKRAFVDGETAALAEGEFRPPYAVALAQEDMPFVPSASPVWGEAGLPASVWPEDADEPDADDPHWTKVGEFVLRPAQLVSVYAQKNNRPVSSRESFRRLAFDLQSRLNGRLNRSVSLFYSFVERDFASLPGALQRVEAAACHAVFCGRGALLCADDLPLAIADPTSRLASRALRPVHPGLAAEAIRQLDAERFESVFNRLFETIVRPIWDLPLLYETVHAVTSAGSELLAARGMAALEPLDPRRFEPVYDIGELRERLRSWIGDIRSSASDRPHLSGKLLKAVRYMQDHFHEDINIEDVAYSLGISASYLHQLFKREMNRTFLDYLTELRIERAKRILDSEDAKMTDVCARVGYRSPQHFSQVFRKATGLSPHQYRDGAGVR